MRYEYFRPAPDLRNHVGSYYVMEMTVGATDIVRVEIPHIRFLVGGESVLQHGDSTIALGSPSAIVCGPSLKAGRVAVSDGSTIVGASLTPLGWQELLGVPMHELADRKALLDDFHPGIMPEQVQDRLLSARDDGELLAVVDSIFRSLIVRRKPVREDFIAAATDWVVDPFAPGIDALSERLELSSRQLDRLCNTYFGAPPKRLQRMFRALHVCNQLAWTGETDWRQAAGDRYYDQAHLIRDFKELIGCTPGEFIRGRNMMVRFDLIKRKAIVHESRLSLIG